MTDGSLPSQARRSLRRARNAGSRLVRAAAPEREVARTVHGARLRLPWSHRLPDYVAVHPTYGRNLVDLARALHDAQGGPLEMVDVGANVGDSALQVLAAVEARVLCVEGDPHWLDWLTRNVADEPRVVVEASLVATTEEPLAPVRSGGTTRFVRSETSGSADTVTAAQLVARHPDYAGARLLKSDTDGHDVVLVPALAEAWLTCASRPPGPAPVLFLEYDHDLSRLAGNDPLLVWDRLAGLGYDLVGVWDNHGRPLGSARVAQMRELARVLDVPRRDRGEGRDWDYWDVAVVSAEDESGAAAVTGLVPTGWSHAS